MYTFVQNALPPDTIPEKTVKHLFIYLFVLSICRVQAVLNFLDFSTV